MLVAADWIKTDFDAAELMLYGECLAHLDGWVYWERPRQWFGKTILALSVIQVSEGDLTVFDTGLEDVPEEIFAAGSTLDLAKRR